MPESRTYLERYVAGEHEGVWAELQALGDAVREEPVYRDAQAVACEMMRRVRQNLEMLIPRLVKAGYQFGYGWVQPFATEPFGWERREAYLDMLEYAKMQPTLLTVMEDVEAQIADRQERMRRLRELGAPEIIMRNEERILVELEARPRAAMLLHELEGKVGALPLSMRAWYEVGGGVNLVGFHPGWMRLITEEGEIGAQFGEHGFDPEWGGHPMQLLEPLQIYPLGGHGPHGTDVLSGHRALDGTFQLDIMPNEHSAYLESGQDSFEYTVVVPCAGADAPLLSERHEATFVNYLRICLRWAGFPGWERLRTRPEHEIESLTAGFLPF